jgi:uncharacterized phiE125 gp8 family phage protein
MALLNVKTISREDSELAITLSQAKAHCFIAEDDTTQDSILSNLILTAQSILENDVSVPYCFSPSQFVATYSFDRQRILLPKSPVVSIEKIEKRNGTEWQTIPSSEYELEQGDELDFVVIRNAYNQQNIRITFTAGAETIRKDLQIAVAQLVAHLYEYRGISTAQETYNNPVYKLITSGMKRISF